MDDKFRRPTAVTVDLHFTEPSEADAKRIRKLAARYGMGPQPFSRSQERFAVIACGIFWVLGVLAGYVLGLHRMDLLFLVLVVGVTAVLLVLAWRWNAHTGSDADFGDPAAIRRAGRNR